MSQHGDPILLCVLVCLRVSLCLCLCVIQTLFMFMLPWLLIKDIWCQSESGGGGGHVFVPNICNLLYLLPIRVNRNRSEPIRLGCIIDTWRPQLEKVFLPPGTCFLRQNFPNIEEEFS